MKPDNQQQLETRYSQTVSPSERKNSLFSQDWVKIVIAIFGTFVVISIILFVLYLSGLRLILTNKSNKNERQGSVVCGKNIVDQYLSIMNNNNTENITSDNMIQNMNNRKTLLTNLANDIKGMKNIDSDATCQAIIGISYQNTGDADTANQYFVKVKDLANDDNFVNSFIGLKELLI